MSQANKKTWRVARRGNWKHRGLVTHRVTVWSQTDSVHVQYTSRWCCCSGRGSPKVKDSVLAWLTRRRERWTSVGTCPRLYLSLLLLLRLLTFVRQIWKTFCDSNVRLYRCLATTAILARNVNSSFSFSVFRLSFSFITHASPSPFPVFLGLPAMSVLCLLLFVLLLTSSIPCLPSSLSVFHWCPQGFPVLSLFIRVFLILRTRR